MGPAVIVSDSDFMDLNMINLIMKNTTTSDNYMLNSYNMAMSSSPSSISPSPILNAEDRCIASPPNIPLYSFIIAGILTGIICIIGLIGNFFSTVVLIKSQLSVSVNLLLLGLTFCDTLVIIYSFLTFVIPPWLGFFSIGFWYLRDAFPLMGPFLLPLGHFGRTGSFYFTVALTIERFVVVCWPLKAKSWCTNRRAFYFTIGVFLFTLLYTLPKWFEVYTIEIKEVITNITSASSSSITNEKPVIICYALEKTALATDQLYRYCSNLLYLLIMGILPFSTLAVLNFCIYREIRWSTLNRPAITGSQLTENSIAIMLLCVVLVFFICALPATILNLLDLFSIITHYRPLTDTSIFLVTVNSCANFAIYYLCGQKFRNNFAMIWNQYCCNCCHITTLVTGSVSSKMNIKTECELI